MPSYTNIFEDIKFRDIVLLLFFIILIYLIYKVNTNNNENFDVTTSSGALPVSAYAQGEAIVNFGKIITSMYTENDLLIIPTNTTTISNDLVVNGNVTFTNKNTMIMEIFPQYMIIAWMDSANIPLGWAPCDGNTYILINTDNITYYPAYPSYPIGSAVIKSTIPTTSTDVFITTPDLRGRFILGASLDINGKQLSNNAISIDIIPRIQNTFSTTDIYQKDGITPNPNLGEETHILVESEIPLHNHTIKSYASPAWTEDNDCDDGGWQLHSDFYAANVQQTPKLYPTTSTGGNSTNTTDSHNNMPPYYVLMYIIKL